MEVSARAWSTDPTTPKKKCENSSVSYGHVPSGAGADVFTLYTTRSGGDVLLEAWRRWLI